MTNPSDETTIPFPEEPGGGRTAPEPDLHRPGDEIGPYKLVSVLGEGGLGSVWLAERRRPFVQRVALKLIKAGMDTKQVLARFEQERQALALMNHPCIAKVLDGGMTNSGRPYFVMEYVQGDPITEFCDARKLGIRERLVLFERACDAIQHAHLKGVIHRDITPRNILAFAGPGGEPGLKVIDFGLAKAMGQGLTAQTMVTEIGQMVGTADYMSPEQADPTGSGVDTRTDIYSLGVLLYELMSGAKPFDLANRARQEIQQIIQHEDPPAPSVRLSSQSTKDAAAASRIEKARAMRIAEIVRTLRTELEWIPLKAMRKEPQHRYQSAMALAEDVRNYLEGRPLVAAPERWAYRSRKFLAKHRQLIAAGGAIMIALLTGLAATTWQWREATRNRDLALARQHEAETSSRAREEALEVAKARQLEAEAERQKAEAARVEAEAQRRDAAALFTYTCLDRALNAAAEGDRANTERQLTLLKERGERGGFLATLAGAVLSQAEGRELPTPQGPSPAIGISCAEASPARGMLVIGLDDGRVNACEVKAGFRWIGPLEAFTDRVELAAFDSRGRFVAVASRGGEIALLDLSEGAIVGRFDSGLGGPPRSIALAADDSRMRWLAAADDAMGLVAWDLTAGPPQRRTLGGTNELIIQLAASDDSRLLAAVSADGTVTVWDSGRGTPTGPPVPIPSGYASSVAFGPEGSELACGGIDGKVHRWSLDRSTGRIDGVEPADSTQVGHSEITRLQYRPDGDGISASDDSGSTWIVRSDDKKAVETGLAELGSSDTAWRLGNGSLALSSGAMGELRLRVVGRHGGTIYRRSSVPETTKFFELTPTEGVVACASRSGRLHFHDTTCGEPVGPPIRRHVDEISALARSGDGHILASMSGDGVVIYDALRYETIDSFAQPIVMTGDYFVSAEGSARYPSRAPSALALNRDGSVVAWSNEQPGSITVWDRATRTSRNLQAPSDGKAEHQIAELRSLMFHASGEYLFAIKTDQTVTRWRLSDGRTTTVPLDGEGVTRAGTIGSESSGTPAPTQRKPLEAACFLGDELLLAAAPGDEDLFGGNATELIAVPLVRSDSPAPVVPTFLAPDADSGFRTLSVRLKLSPDESFVIGELNENAQIWDGRTGQPLAISLGEGVCRDVGIGDWGIVLSSTNGRTGQSDEAQSTTLITVTALDADELVDDWLAKLGAEETQPANGAGTDLPGAPAGGGTRPESIDERRLRVRRMLAIGRSNAANTAAELRAAHHVRSSCEKISILRNNRRAAVAPKTGASQQAIAELTADLAEAAKLLREIDTMSVGELDAIDDDDLIQLARLRLEVPILEMLDEGTAPATVLTGRALERNSRRKPAHLVEHARACDRAGNGAAAIDAIVAARSLLDQAACGTRAMRRTRSELRMLLATTEFVGASTDVRAIRAMQAEVLRAGIEESRSLSEQDYRAIEALAELCWMAGDREEAIGHQRSVIELLRDVPGDPRMRDRLSHYQNASIDDPVPARLTSRRR